MYLIKMILKLLSVQGCQETRGHSTVIILVACSGPCSNSSMSCWCWGPRAESSTAGEICSTGQSVFTVAVFVQILHSVLVCIKKKKSKNDEVFKLKQVKFWSQLAISENCVRSAVEPLECKSIKSLLTVASIRIAVILAICREAFQLEVRLRWH